MQTAPLLFSSPYPTANAIQILHGYSAFGALSNVYYLLRNLMINIAGKALFFASSPAKKPFSTARAFALKLLPEPSVARSAAVHMRTTEALTGTGLSDRDNPHVHAYPIKYLVLFLVWYIDSRKKEPLAVSENQVAFTTLGLEKLELGLTTDIGNRLPPFDRPNAHNLSGGFPRKDAQIVSDPAVRAKHSLDFPVELIGIGDFRNDANNDLRRKRKLFSDLPVEKRLQCELVKLARIPGQLAKAISCRIGQFKRAQQRVGLFGQRLQLHLAG